jgi:hypothetical protein
MYSWRNFVDKVKRYFPLEGFEKRGLLITILILSFIFSFREWGVESFDVALGLQNLVITLVFVVLGFVVHELAHRTIAVWMGYRSQYKVWIMGLVIGLIVAFVSNGTLYFIAPGMLAIAVMFLAVVMKSLFEATGSIVFYKAMIMYIWISIFDMLPIPPFNGSRTFFGSRYVYVFVLGSLIGCAALLAYLSGIVPILGAIVLGALILLVFFAFIDKRW